MARRHVLEKLLLVLRDFVKLRQPMGIGGGLIQHHHEIGVCQHRPPGFALQDFFRVLGSPGAVAVILADSAPEIGKKLARVLVLEKKGKLVRVDKGNLSLPVVAHDAAQQMVYPGRPGP